MMKEEAIVLFKPDYKRWKVQLPEIEDILVELIEYALKHPDFINTYRYNINRITDDIHSDVMTLLEYKYLIHDYDYNILLVPIRSFIKHILEVLPITFKEGNFNPNKITVMPEDIAYMLHPY